MSTEIKRGAVKMTNEAVIVVALSRFPDEFIEVNVSHEFGEQPWWGITKDKAIRDMLIASYDGTYDEKQSISQWANQWVKSHYMRWAPVMHCKQL
jgi:hypothetical protein